MALPVRTLPPPTPDPRDAEILRAVAAGRRDEAMALVRAVHGPTIERLALRMVRDAAMAEDVVQEALLGIHQDLHTVRDSGSLRSWLLSVTSHRALDEIRRRERRRRHLVDGAELRDVADPAAGPGARLEARRELGLLEQRIRALPAKAQAALSLHYRDGLTFEQVARLTGERGDAVQIRVRRAVLRLQDQLRRRGVERGARAARVA